MNPAGSNLIFGIEGRDLSLDATLDALAQKVQAFGTQGATALGQVAQQQTQLAQATEKTAATVTNAGNAWEKFWAKAGAIATGQLIYKGIADIESIVSKLTASIIELPAAYEQAQIGFKAMLGGNAQAADDMLGKLQQIANVTPFKFSDEQAAARTMLGLGESAQRVLPMLVDVDTAVAAVGKGEAEVQRVAAALAKMDAEGRVSARIMNEITLAGIPAWNMLAESMGLSVAQVRALSESGDLAASSFDKAFHEYTVKHWGNALAEQSQTFNGLISTAQDLFEQFSKTFGMPIIQELEPKLRGAVAALQDPAVVATIHQWGVEAAKFLDTLIQAGGQIAAWLGLQLPEVKTPQFDLNNLGSWTDGLTVAKTQARDLDGEVASLQNRVANIRDQQAAVDAGYQQQIAGIRDAQAAYDAGMENRLSGLRDQARLLDQAYQSEKARRDLNTIGNTIARDRALAVDIYSSQGRAAAERLPDELARQADIQSQAAHDQSKNAIANQEAGLTNAKRLTDQHYQAQTRGLEAAKAAQDAYFQSLERGYQRQIATLQDLKKEQKTNDDTRDAGLAKWQANVAAATDEYANNSRAASQSVADGEGVTGHAGLFDKVFGTAAEQQQAGKDLGVNLTTGLAVAVREWVGGKNQSPVMAAIMGGATPKDAFENWLSQTAGIENLGAQLAKTLFPDWKGLGTEAANAAAALTGNPQIAAAHAAGQAAANALINGDTGPANALINAVTGGGTAPSSGYNGPYSSGGAIPGSASRATWFGGQPIPEFLGGGRAAGGPVSEGWYTVGERGPELLHAGGAGAVVPGGGQLTITIQTDRGDVLWRGAFERNRDFANKQIAISMASNP